MLVFDRLRQWLKRLQQRRLRSRVSNSERVTRAGRDAYVYRHEGRSVTVEVEMLVGEPGRVISAGSIGYWDPPHNAIEVSETERERVIGALCEHFRSLGLAYEVARDCCDGATLP